MAGNLGRAVGTIEFEFNGQDAIDRARRGLADVDSSGKSAREGFDTLKTGAGAAGAGIVAGLGLAVTSAANFEKGLSAIQAVSGSTAGEMDKVRQKALDIGADTSFSASEGAAAIEELVKAGVSVPDVMAGAADATVALAAAGGVDLPTAATIASNAMNQFGLSAGEMPNIANKIAGAANASAIDVGQFGQSMSAVGAVANTVGLSFDDTATSIALLGNAGITGSDAGTSLKTMLMGLQPQTKEQTALFKELGLMTEDGANKFFDAQGKIRPMSEIAGELQTALSGMSDAQRTAALETMFGADAIRAAAVIAEGGAQGFDQMATSMGKVSAADVAATRMGNLAGQIEAMKGSLETAAIQLGSVLIPMLTSVVGAVTGAIGAFTGLSSGAQTAIVAIAGIGGGMLLAVAGIIQLVQMVQSAVAAYNAIRTAVIAFNIAQKAGAVATALVTAAQWLWNAALTANPIGIVIVLIAALVAGLIWFFTQTETGRAIIQAVWSAIQTAIAATVSWITGTAVPALVAAWQWIVQGVQSLWQGIVSAWNAITSAVSSAVSAVVSVVMSVVGTLQGWWNNFWTGLTIIVQVVWAAIVAFVQAYISTLQSIIVAVLSFIMSAWSAFWNGPFGELIRAAWDLVVAIVTFAINTVSNVISAGLSAISAIWSSVWNAISSVASAVWNAIVAVISAAWNLVSSTVMSGLSALQGLWSAAWNAISAVASAVWNVIASVISAAWQRVQSLVTAGLSALQSAWSAAWNAISAVVSAVWNAIASVVQAAWSRVQSLITAGVNTVRSVLTAGFEAARAAVVNAFTAMVAAAATGASNLISRVQGMISTVRGLFSGAASWLVQAGKDILQGLINGVTSMVGALTSKLKSITSLIPASKGPEKVDRVLLEENGELIMKGLIHGLNNQVPALQRMLGGVTVGIPGSLGGGTAAASASESRTFGRGGSTASSTGSSGGGAPLIGTQNIYNPVAEPASQTTQNQNRKRGMAPSL